MPKDNPEEYPKRKLQVHNNQFSLNIPKSIAQAKGWHKGTVLTIRLNEKGQLLIDRS